MCGCVGVWVCGCVGKNVCVQIYHPLSCTKRALLTRPGSSCATTYPYILGEIFAAALLLIFQKKKQSAAALLLPSRRAGVFHEAHVLKSSVCNAEKKFSGKTKFHEAHILKSSVCSALF
jgi:hypothetical protein